MVSAMSTKVLSIVIPCYNEEGTIVELLQRVAAAPLSIAREIIVVNDGSRDRSPELVRQWMASAQLRPGDRAQLLDKVNGGKGSAVRQGIVASTGDIVIIQDADLEYDPGDYQSCIDPILAGTATVVYGSRERLSANRLHSALSFYLGGLMVTYWMNLLYGASMTDEPTCYKTFDGPLIRALLFTGNKFDWEPEITAKLLRLGYTIHEVPVKYFPRKITEGKKIRWNDGVAALWVALRWRWAPLGEERRKLQGLPEEATRLRQEGRACLWLWGMIMALLVCRILLALPGWDTPESAFFRPDSPTYVEPARALLAHGSLTEAPDSPVAATLRPPGFSLLCAALLGLSGGDLRWPVLFFCLLGALTALPVYRAGVWFGGHRVGLLAAGLFGLQLTSLSATPLYLSDTLYAFLVAWQLLCFLRFWRQHRLLDYWLGVLLAAVGTLVRPVGLPWVVPALFLVLIMTPKSWWKRGLGVLGAVIIYAVVLCPWMARNAHADAGFVLDTNTGNTLYFHNAAALLAVAEGGSAEDYRQQWQADLAALKLSEPERFPTVKAEEDWKKAQAVAIIRRHPLTYLRLHFRPFVLLPDAPSFLELLGYTQGGRGTFEVLNRDGVLAAVRHYFGGQLWLLALVAPLAALAGLCYLAAGVELLRRLGRRQWYFAWLFLAFVVYFIILPGPIAMPRYALPALPLICLLAASLVFTWKAGEPRLDPRYRPR
jgi:dolichol-phosphate mannosyltransferase